MKNIKNGNANRLMMGFKQGLLKILQSNLIYWKIQLNENEDILIVIEDDKVLKLSYDNLQAILWLLIAEVPFKAEKVKMILTNKRKTTEYYYTFDPGNRVSIF